MTIASIADVEFGTELPAFEPDTSMANVRTLCDAAGWDSPRFKDHDEARKPRATRCDRTRHHEPRIPRRDDS